MIALYILIALAVFGIIEHKTRGKRTYNTAKAFTIITVAAALWPIVPLAWFLGHLILTYQWRNKK